MVPVIVQWHFETKYSVLFLKKGSKILNVDMINTLKDRNCCYSFSESKELLQKPLAR